MNDKQLTSEVNTEQTEQRENSDSAYSGVQPSETESSDSGSLPESEEDSGGVFSAPSEEQSDSSAPMTDNLDGKQRVCCR